MQNLIVLSEYICIILEFKWVEAHTDGKVINLTGHV